ncbi:DUF2721 domain-containing protein [Aquisphaera insulae]|uniref:DUF2721 domain-containing protein n=1 Tax=Aquisphaera insulae TaxID=2712864 RepID=UPI0013E9B99D|nr:DUF2721 domain-containing protein [Aquisphaera insulae]
MPTTSESYSILTAMITPALFMTSNGSLIISTSNRMARVADRIRHLDLELDGLSHSGSSLDFVEDRVAFVTEELHRNVWRVERIHIALSLLYLSLAAFVATSLTMAIDSFFSNNVAFIPTILAMVGVVLEFAACVQLTRESREALKGKRLEVRFYERIRKKRAEAGRNQSEASTVAALGPGP